MQISHIFEKTIKINKKIAELNYKVKYMEKNKKDISQLSEERDTLIKEKNNLMENLKSKELEFFVPNQNKIDEINVKLANYDIDQILLAMSKKQGTVWELLSERGKYTKNNYFHANLIGKLAEHLFLIQKDSRQKIIDAIKQGQITDKIEINEEASALKIARYLYRLGINAQYKEGGLVNEEFTIKEIGIKLGENIVYVPENIAGDVERNERELNDVGMRIQIKNAEKKIKEFNEQDFKEFEDLQRAYLDLLKRRESFVSEYKEE